MRNNLSYYFLPPLLMLLSLPSLSQKSDSLIVKKVTFAADLYANKKYDSSLLLCQQTIKAVELNGQQKNVIFTQALQIAGQCYEKKKDATNAHLYYTKAFDKASGNNQVIERQAAFVSLNQLHRLIVTNNWQFSYSPPPTTIEDYIYLSIERVERTGDSLILTILGGMADGITDSTTEALIYSRADTSAKTSFDYANKARIISTTQNRTIAIVRAGTEIVENDIAIVRAQIPITLQKSALRKYALLGIIVTDNYKQQVFNYRYLSHFYTSETDALIMDILKNTVAEIVEYFGEDTATNMQFSKKIDEGIFAGQNVMLAMHNSTNQHLQYFLNFLSDFPGKYIGNIFKFSEIYATWMIYNAPMSKKDVTDFLAKLPTRAEQQRQSYNLRNTIKEDKLAGEWLTTGLLAASYDNLKETSLSANLLKSYGEAVEDYKQKGWSQYLQAVGFERNDRMQVADSMYQLALRTFELANDEEGALWAKSAIDNLHQTASVSFTVQSGHLMNFYLAMSPNPRYFASGSEDNLVKIWDALAGKEIRTIKAHSNEILSINYSKDGRYLATSSRDSTIKIWNAYNYSLINTLKTTSIESTVLFSPDSKYLLSAGRDSTIKLWNPATGDVLKIFRKHKGRVTGLAFDAQDASIFVSSSTDSMVYKWHIDSTDILRWYKENARVLDVKLSNNGAYMATYTSDSLINIWYYAKSKRYFSDTVAVKIMGNSKHFASGDFSPDGKYLAYPSNHNTINIYDLATGEGKLYPIEKTYFLSDILFTTDGNSFIQKYNLGEGLKITNFQDWTVENAPAKLITKELKQYANPPATIQFDSDNKGLLVLSYNTSLYNFTNGKTEFVNQTAQSVYHQALLLHNRNFSLSVPSHKTSAYIYNNAEKAIADSIVFNNDEKLSAVALAFNDSVIFMGGERGTVRAITTAGKQLLFSTSFYRDEDTYVKRLHIDSVENRLYVIVDYDKVFVLQADNGKILDSLPGKLLYDVTSMPGAVYVSGADGWLYKFNSKNYQLIKKISLNNRQGPVELLKMSHDYTRLAAINSSKNITVLDTQTDRPVYTFRDHSAVIFSIDISPDDKMLASSGLDNRANVYDLTSGNLLITLHTPYEEDFVASDPEGHYMAPKKSLNGVVFNYKNNAFNFEQFDLQFNRPDLILSTLGKANPALVESYHAAYERRLKKLGLTEDQVTTDLHLPLVRILDKLNVRPTTRSDHYELEVECYDSKYPLQRLQVLVNNAPLFDSSGKNIATENRKLVTEKINVPLSLGNNSIKIYCTNAKGSVSLKETFDVYSNYKTGEAPKIYFIGIAVAAYKDSSMNLTYSAKDVRDLVKGFKKVYPDIIIDTLINAKATKSNILQLRKKLETTSVNDKVIAAVTGHGLLSDSLDFYYGTYDIDFKKPQEKGLRYEDLENLFNDIPARQKLLMIDACHSGALDKETLIAQRAIESRDKFVKEVGNRSSIKIKPTKVNLNSTYDLMQNQFADLSGSTGTIVISAAGGLEYAFESPEWNNGVFTYCVRKGFEEKQADKDGGNGDGVVSVQELQQYVSRKVAELTKGRQKPTSRKENLDFDWTIR